MQSMNTCQKTGLSVLSARNEEGNSKCVGAGIEACCQQEWSCHGNEGFDCWQSNRGGCACGRWGQRECFPCTFVQVRLSWNQILVTACVDRVPYHCDSRPLQCHEAFLDEKEKMIGLHRECTPRQGKDLISFEVG